MLFLGVMGHDWRQHSGPQLPRARSIEADGSGSAAAQIPECALALLSERGDSQVSLCTADVQFLVPSRCMCFFEA